MISRPRSIEIWSKLWIAPAVGAAVAVAVASGGLLLDAAVDWEDSPVPVFVGTPDSARTLLQVVASAAATLLSLIFTIIAVVVQLASNQYSPRALRPLVRDRPTHFTIGILVGTFTYALTCLIALDQLRDGDDDSIHSLTLGLVFFLSVLTIATFAVYANHIVHAVRVQKLLERLGGIAGDLVEQEVPKGSSADPVEASDSFDIEQGRRRVVPAHAAGVLIDYDGDTLVEEARRTGTVIRIVPGIGGFVRSGGPIAEILGDGDMPEVVEHLQLSSERTLQRDLTYAIRLIADISARSLSPGDHDPTSSLQALDQLHEILGRLVERPLPDGIHRDADGVARLVITVPTWDDYVELALSETRRLGQDTMQIPRRLLSLLDDLLEAAPPERRPVLEQQRRMVLAGVDEQMEGDDRERASDPDRSGLGI
jgi:uncharacterized membrane protein